MRRLGVSPFQIEQLERLDRLLVHWGRAIDLTGFRSREERVERYFGEALEAARWLPSRGHVVDIGSGGGSPALPMAVVKPELRWTLLEPNQRKALFLKEAVGELSLGGVTVRRSRLEAFELESPVEAVTCRGVALDERAMRRVGSWLRPGGRCIVMTGGAARRRLIESKAPAFPGVLRNQERLGGRSASWVLVWERVEG